MGCSASRSHEFVTKELQNPSPNSSSSSAHSQSSFSRTLSLVHHPAVHKGDTNHLVSLTSTTYGSLLLVNDQSPDFYSMKPHNGSDPQDPLSPDSVINTWELMDGLEGFECHMVHSPVQESHPSSFKSNNNQELDTDEFVESYEFVEHLESKPLWKHLSEEALLAKLDPSVGLSYRKALLSKRFGYKESEGVLKPKIVTSVETKDGTSSLRSLLPNSVFYLKGSEDRIVLYYTSLRGIRKTYEDCCAVRMIFRGFHVCVDERDISMDSSYKKELQCVLEGKALSLPQVFIRGKYIGGAEEIQKLHEAGELTKLVEGFPVMHPGFTCEGCGDARFLPCLTCNGSCKLFEKEEGKLMRCPHCNENGLIRCPGCCS